MTAAPVPLAEQPTPEALKAALDYCGFTRLPHPNLAEDRVEILEVAALLDSFAEQRNLATLQQHERAMAALREAAEYIARDADHYHPFPNNNVAATPAGKGETG